MADPGEWLQGVQSGAIGKDKILEMSLYSSVLRYAVKLWQEGELTWEQSQTLAIVMLLDQLQEQQKQMQEMVNRLPPPPIVVQADIKPLHPNS